MYNAESWSRGPCEVAGSQHRPNLYEYEYVRTYLLRTKEANFTAHKALPANGEGITLYCRKGTL